MHAIPNPGPSTMFLLKLNKSKPTKTFPLNYFKYKSIAVFLLIPFSNTFAVYKKSKIDTIKANSGYHELLNCPSLQLKQTKILDLSENWLDRFYDKDWLAYEKKLEQCENLKHLSLSKCNLSKLSNEDWSKIGSWFEKCKTLTSLNLSSNSLNLLDFNKWQKFEAALLKCTNIEILDVSNNQLHSYLNLHKAGASFSKLNQLEKIILKNNNLEQTEISEWSSFIEKLSDSKSLKILEFDKYVIPYGHERILNQYNFEKTDNITAEIWKIKKVQI
jgi:hypothetical protein